MANRRLALAALLVLVVVAPSPARPADGALVREGIHGNAAYRIEVPARWNGAGSVQTEPLDGHLAERGYAWAATG